MQKRKGKNNETGGKLRISNLRITNLFFEHKPIQQTIWQSPAPYTTVIDVETAKKSISKPKRLCYNEKLST